MEMRSGPKVSGRSRRVAADPGWSLRGVPLYHFVGKSVQPPHFGFNCIVGKSVQPLTLGSIVSHFVGKSVQPLTLGSIVSHFVGKSVRIVATPSLCTASSLP